MAAMNSVVVLWRSKPILRVLSLFLLIAVSVLAAGISDVKASGISGRVDFCAQGGYQGMQVYIPGKQHVVITGSDGHFLFESVKSGKYDIYYSINSKVVNKNRSIEVVADKITDVGVIEFCDQVRLENTQQNTPHKMSSQPIDPANAITPSKSPADSPSMIDRDADGVEAARDCDDNNAAKRPGLVERCDGIDNNCNGVIDDVGSLSVVNGSGRCVRGVIHVRACDKGFSDCDKNALNGCETDTFSDNDNCGQCGNACAGTETCVIGEC